MFTAQKNRAAVAFIAASLLLILVPSYSSAQQTPEAARKVLTRVIPQYPSLARPMRIEGTVRADVVVSPTGKMKSVDVRGGHPLLVQAAEEALRQWKWEPTAHETHEIIELRFTP